MGMKTATAKQPKVHMLAEVFPGGVTTACGLSRVRDDVRRGNVIPDTMGHPTCLTCRGAWEWRQKNGRLGERRSA
jgi:hypothetical protein